MTNERNGDGVGAEIARSRNDLLVAESRLRFAEAQLREQVEYHERRADAARNETARLRGEVTRLARALGEANNDNAALDVAFKRAEQRIAILEAELGHHPIGAEQPGAPWLETLREVGAL